MVTTKKKKLGRTIKINIKGYLLIALLLGIIISLGLFRYIFNSSTTISIPIYEDINLISTDLDSEITNIDNAVYGALYLKEVSEDDVSFSIVRPEKEGNNEWNFTEQIIYLSNISILIQLKGIIDIELSKLKPAVNYKTEQVSESELNYDVFALGFYTHKIRLIQKEQEAVFHKNLPKIAIVIDDIGYKRDISFSFIQLDMPIGFSFLPLSPHSQSIAEKAAKHNRDLLLHLPMEPKNYPSVDPGPGALLMKMDDDEIRKIIASHLGRIPGIKGVNNHMGSYYTEREDKMMVVLGELKKRNLFFVDSRTTSRTVAFKLARKMGVPAVSRSVFLDNDLSPKAIKFQMERLFGMARHSGAALGIGHPNKETLRILQDYLNRIKNDFKVVPVSDLVS